MQKTVSAFLLGRKVFVMVTGQQMTPIKFEVSLSKVKVTVAFYSKTMSPQYP